MKKISCSRYKKWLNKLGLALLDGKAMGDGSGSKIFEPHRARSIFGSSGWVSHLWFGFGKSPLKIPNFSIFSLRIKKNLIGSGQKVHGSKLVRPLNY